MECEDKGLGISITYVFGDSSYKCQKTLSGVPQKYPYYKELILKRGVPHHPFHDLNVVTSLTQLKSLNLASCGMYDITGIQKLSRLTSLDLSDNPNLRLSPSLF